MRPLRGQVADGARCSAPRLSATAPGGALRPVFQQNATGRQLVADTIGFREVPFLARGPACCNGGLDLVGFADVTSVKPGFRLVLQQPQQCTARPQGGSGGLLVLVARLVELAGCLVQPCDGLWCVKVVAKGRNDGRGRPR